MYNQLSSNHSVRLRLSALLLLNSAHASFFIKAGFAVALEHSWEFRHEFTSFFSQQSSWIILLLFQLLSWMHKRSHISDPLRRNLQPPERTVVDGFFSKSRILRSLACFSLSYPRAASSCRRNIRYTLLVSTC